MAQEFRLQRAGHGRQGRLPVQDHHGSKHERSNPGELYRPESIPDVLQWVEDEGDEIVYIYGEVDPWTAGQVQLTGAADAIKIIQPRADHQVKILDLDLRDMVLQTLEGWLGLDLSYQAAAPPLSVSPEAAFFGTPYDPTLDPVGIPGGRS